MNIKYFFVSFIICGSLYASEARKIGLKIRYDRSKLSTQTRTDDQIKKEFPGLTDTIIYQAKQNALCRRIPIDTWQEQDFIDAAHNNVQKNARKRVVTSAKTDKAADIKRSISRSNEQIRRQYPDLTDDIIQEAKYFASSKRLLIDTWQKQDFIDAARNNAQLNASRRGRYRGHAEMGEQSTTTSTHPEEARVQSIPMSARMQIGNLIN
jgi:uncharacterized protein (DUF433 family)